ncbi:hypothetical protein T10_6786 [Trichinella papuae]|uniref:Secreted protein n=1 Tax=Trichinella papuae TaxID=268474 RepID=A0A0V1MIQ6_9BILA|nr:hypothetical protein T10_6786 [Trichinella papuae]
MQNFLAICHLAILYSFSSAYFPKRLNEYNVFAVRRRLVNVQIFVRGLAVCFHCKLFTRKCMRSFIRMLCVEIRGISLNGCWRTVCGVSALALSVQ